jgi:hypothetical protein
VAGSRAPGDVIGTAVGVTLGGTSPPLIGMSWSVNSNRERERVFAYSSTILQRFQKSMVFPPA